MREISINDVDYEVPGSWNELSKKQLLYLAKLMRSYERISPNKICVEMLLLCIGARVTKLITPEFYQIDTKYHTHVLKHEEITVLSSIFEYLIYRDDHGLDVFSPELSVNHFKDIKIFGKRLYGPSDMLDSITYDQYVWIQTWMSQLGSNDNALDEIINVLYRTKSGKKSMWRVKRMKKDVKTVILWYVLGSCSMLQILFPNVFDGATSGDNVNVFDNQQRIIDGLAKGDVTKKNQVRESMLYDAMYVMDEAAKKQKELEKQYKKK